MPEKSLLTIMAQKLCILIRSEMIFYFPDMGPASASPLLTGFSLSAPG